jgi:predicted DNA-binding WGR domain protein
MFPIAGISLLRSKRTILQKFPRNPLSAGGHCLAYIVPDELRSPIKHHLMLPRVDLGQGIRRFYSPLIERDLFETVRLVRDWGRIGTKGQRIVAVYPDEIAAGKALEIVARAKRWRRVEGPVRTIPDGSLLPR